MSRHLSFDYNHVDYEPAFPTLPIRIHAAGNYIDTVALVDSGADATMLPKELLQAVRSEVVDLKQVRGVVGQAVAVEIHQVSIQIGSDDIWVHGIHAVAMLPDTEPVIGRDVINQLVIVLNGHAATMSITDWI